MEVDLVKNPSHYTWYKDKYGTELFDILNCFSYVQANFFKYVLRAGRKKGEEIRDLKKALNTLYMPKSHYNLGIIDFPYKGDPWFICSSVSLVDAICTKLNTPSMKIDLHRQLNEFGYICGDDTILQISMCLKVLIYDFKRGRCSFNF